MFIYVLTTSDWDIQTGITLFSTYEKAMAWLEHTARDRARHNEYDDEVVNGDLEDLLEAMDLSYSIDQHQVDPSI